jgi:hypothetical protein
MSFKLYKLIIISIITQNGDIALLWAIYVASRVVFFYLETSLRDLDCLYNRKSTHF